MNKYLVNIIESFIDETLLSSWKGNKEKGISPDPAVTRGLLQDMISLRRAASERVGYKIKVTADDGLPFGGLTRGAVEDAKRVYGNKKKPKFLDTPSVNVRFNDFSVRNALASGQKDKTEIIRNIFGHEVAHHVEIEEPTDRLATLPIADRNSLSNISRGYKAAMEGRTWRKFRDLTKEYGLKPPDNNVIKASLSTYNVLPRKIKTISPEERSIQNAKKYRASLSAEMQATYDAVTSNRYV